MEYLPPIILAVVFGLFAIFVKPVRITSYVILATVAFNLWMMDSFNELAAQGETVGLLIMGVANLCAAMALLSFTGDASARKAPQQAIIFVLFAVTNGSLAIELFSEQQQQYYFYDVHDNVIWALTAAHVFWMGGHYEDLFENFKESCSGFSGRYRHYFGGSYWISHWKRRNDSMGVSGGPRNNDIHSSIESDRKRKKSEESAGYNGKTGKEGTGHHGA